MEIFYATGLQKVRIYRHIFQNLGDDAAVPDLRKYNKIAPLPYDTTDFSSWGIIALILLVVLFLGLIYIVLDARIRDDPFRDVCSGT